MAMPTFTMRQLLEAGVHFGHHTRRWNPKMKPYLFGVRNGVHIIDLTKTVPLLRAGAAAGPRGRRQRRPRAVRRHQAPGRGARRRRGQALRPVLRQPPLAGRHAHQLADHLGLDQAPARARRAAEGRRRRPHQEGAARPDARARQARARRWAASRTWAALPDMLFVIDTNKEAIAVQEARKLRHPGRGGARQQLRSRRHRLSRSRATTTPSAPCRSTAT